jgi:hypothetical protein
MPRLVGLDLALAKHPACPRLHARQRVRWCVSAPITIICTVPSFG